MCLNSHFIDIFVGKKWIICKHTFYYFSGNKKYLVIYILHNELIPNLWEWCHEQNYSRYSKVFYLGSRFYTSSSPNCERGVMSRRRGEQSPNQQITSNSMSPAVGQHRNGNCHICLIWVSETKYKDSKDKS